MKTAPLLFAAAVLMAHGAAAETRIKAEGAAGAGVCAGALELSAGMASRSESANALRVVNMQRARDFFAELPTYPKQEITDNANAFIKLMNDRMTGATSDTVRGKITKEITSVARGCFEIAKRHTQMVVPAAPQAAQPLPTQPSQPAQ